MLLECSHYYPYAMDRNHNAGFIIKIVQGKVSNENDSRELSKSIKPKETERGTTSRNWTVYKSSSEFPFDQVAAKMGFLTWVHSHTFR